MKLIISLFISLFGISCFADTLKINKDEILELRNSTTLRIRSLDDHRLVDSYNISPAITREDLGDIADQIDLISLSKSQIVHSAKKTITKDELKETYDKALQTTTADNLKLHIMNLRGKFLILSKSCKATVTGYEENGTPTIK
jgi:hypothetical protein